MVKIIFKISLSDINLVMLELLKLGIKNIKIKEAEEFTNSPLKYEIKSTYNEPDE